MNRFLLVSETPPPDLRATTAGLLSLMLSLAGAFAAAWFTRDIELFSLVPAPGLAPDVQKGQRLDLHRTFFTIWAALVLVTPALALVFFRNTSGRAARYWLAFWTAALVAFLVHLFWAVSVIFGNDWQRILQTPRVSAPVLDTVFAVWWCIDVGIAWFSRSEASWVKFQRVLVHMLAFVLFFMGAAHEGELLASRVLGWTMAMVVGLAALSWATARLRWSFR